MGGDWELTFIDRFRPTPALCTAGSSNIIDEPPGARRRPAAATPQIRSRSESGIRYTLTVGNNGAGAASNVTVVTTRPKGTGYVSASASRGELQPAQAAE